MFEYQRVASVKGLSTSQTSPHDAIRKQSHLMGEEGWDLASIIQNGYVSRSWSCLILDHHRPSILGHVDPFPTHFRSWGQTVCLHLWEVPLRWLPTSSEQILGVKKTQLGDGWHLNWRPQSWRNSGGLCWFQVRWPDDPSDIDINIPYQSWFCLLFPILYI